MHFFIAKYVLVISEMLLIGLVNIIKPFFIYNCWASRGQVKASYFRS